MILYYRKMDLPLRFPETNRGIKFRHNHLINTGLEQNETILAKLY